MVAFLTSLIFVVLAEMGDKTQLLAMAFAGRYKPSQVMWGVFLATILNHGLAVAVGGLLVNIVPLTVISKIAAISFIIFGIWTIHGDSLHGEDKKTYKWGPIATVAIAFFLAEMGDKTQLATVSLAVKYPQPVLVLMGTTLGMLVADAIGIVFGVVMHKHLPDHLIKWISAGIFILFGIISLFFG